MPTLLMLLEVDVRRNKLRRLLAKVHFDRYRREKTYANITSELSSEGIDMSASTI